MRARGGDTSVKPAGLRLEYCEAQPRGYRQRRQLRPVAAAAPKVAETRASDGLGRREGDDRGGCRGGHACCGSDPSITLSDMTVLKQYD